MSFVSINAGNYASVWGILAPNPIPGTASYPSPLTSFVVFESSLIDQFGKNLFMFDGYQTYCLLVDANTVSNVDVRIEECFELHNPHCDFLIVQPK